MITKGLRFILRMEISVCKVLHHHIHTSGIHHNRIVVNKEIFFLLIHFETTNLKQREMLNIKESMRKLISTLLDFLFLHILGKTADILDFNFIIGNIL